MPSRLLRAVIFDLGGTLMYPRESWPPIMERAYAALADSLCEQGFNLDRHTVHDDLKNRLDHYFTRRDADLFEATYLAVLRGLLAEAGHPDVPEPPIRRALDAMYSHTQPNWTLEEDAMLALRTLEAGGYRLGMVSNAGDNQDVFQLVERFGIEPYFDFILTSAACSYRKPHPRIFELALAHWGIPAQEVAMVGDSLEADVQGAKAAGLYSVWITRRVTKPLARPEVRPDARIRTLSELPVLFSNLLRQAA
ncbi:MAG: HAD family hydrolase [Chloroflexota bacterium]